MSSKNKFSLKDFLSTRKGQILLGLIAVFIFVLIGAVPKTVREQSAKRFSKPLFRHEVPEDSRVVQTYAQQDKQNGVTATFATIILQSPMTKEELTAFYSDIEYPPARSEDKVTLSVLPVQDDALTVLKNAGLYQQDGGDYWYIYLYSAPPEV